MTDYYTLAQIDDLSDSIRERISVHPKVGIILGSGLGELADSIESANRIPYSEIPPWPISTVIGHQGQLVIGNLEGQAVITMQGRAHYNEGYDMPKIGLPIRVMQRLGIEYLIVTNAAGGVNPNYVPGVFMLITDHINLMGMSGLTPL